MVRASVTDQPQADGMLMRDLYRELITSALDYEENRRGVHNTLGLGVISASGVLTSFTLAIAFLGGGRTAPHLLPAASRTLLVVSICTLAVAAMLALFAILPGAYYGIDAEYLRQKVTQEGWTAWEMPVAKADWEYEARRVEFLDRAHILNSRRGRYIRAAVIAEVMAIAAMAAGVMVFLVH